MTAIKRYPKARCHALVLLVAWVPYNVGAFSTMASVGSRKPSLLTLKSSSWNSDNDYVDRALDANTWISVQQQEDQTEDWEVKLRKYNNISNSHGNGNGQSVSLGVVHSDDDATEQLLDILASQQAQEVEFNRREAERADKVRRMEEWGFEPSTIAAAMDVAVEEVSDKEMEDMTSYLKDSYFDLDDPFQVESHTKVPRDPETNQPIRNRMVYVDEHSCIGCTNCAMIAQSTFFMEEENGRARVFEQWGDDEATIQTAIETCPVDCIHYVPYQELVQLEVQRRNQHINVVGGLVSRAERGAGNGLGSFLTPRSFGGKQFTDAPRISRAYSNEERKQELQAKERVGLVRERRRRLEEDRRRDNKVVDL